MVSPCVDPASRSPLCVQARKGERQGKNPFLFTMLFEKSKENLEITTWYYKSFPSALRLSELGRGRLAGRRGRGRGMQYGTFQAQLAVSRAFQGGQLMMESVRNTLAVPTSLSPLSLQAQVFTMLARRSQRPLSYRPPPKTARSTLRFLSFCILASVLEFL